MYNPITILIKAIFKYINVKLTNISMAVTNKMKQTYKRWKNISAYRMINHCLYKHEMENVPNYIKLPIAITVTAVTVLAIVHQANAGRYRPEE